MFVSRVPNCNGIIIKDKTPGPGHYDKASEFGHRKTHSDVTQ
jgi:hypothetical protein